MNYAEASYFEGYHFSHIAALYEKQRLEQIERRMRFHRENGFRERRHGGRSIHVRY